MWLFRSMLTALLSCLGTCLLAADIQVVELRPSVGLVRIVGEIVAGDELQFLMKVSRFEEAAVILESPGGNLNAGLRIGEEIFRRRFHTGIAPGSLCTSACALIWVAGASRMMSRTARVGFHAAHRRSADGASISSSGNALVGAYLARLGLPDRAIIYMTSAPPREMAWLDVSSANQIGLSVKQLDTEPAVGQGASGATRWFVDGLDPNGDNWLALKAGPALSTRRLGKLPPGELLIVSEARGDWKRVTTQNGQQGWVHRKYVSCCR
jgi:hypothetical protein